MWIIKPAPMPVHLLCGRTGVISAENPQSSPRKYDGRIYRRIRNTPTKSETSESKSVGGVGRQILLGSSTESNLDERSREEKEISGSDVLRAIQRAAAQRKRSNGGDKKKTKKMMMAGVELLSSVDESTVDNGVDYRNVRPLRIKSDWKQRLEQYEKCLKEFQETEL